MFNIQNFFYMFDSACITSPASPNTNALTVIISSERTDTDCDGASANISEYYI